MPKYRYRLLVKCKPRQDFRRHQYFGSILYSLKLYFCRRLNLPGEIVEDGRESASYDVEKGKEMKSGCNSTCTVGPSRGTQTYFLG